MAWCVPSHYLNQRWHAGHCTFVNKFQSNWNQITSMFRNCRQCFKSARCILNVTIWLSFRKILLNFDENILACIFALIFRWHVTNACGLAFDLGSGCVEHSFVLIRECFVRFPAVQCFIGHDLFLNRCLVRRKCQRHNQTDTLTAELRPTCPWTLTRILPNIFGSSLSDTKDCKQISLQFW